MIGFVSETAVSAFQHRHDRLIDEIAAQRRAFKIEPTAARMRVLESLEDALVTLKREASRVGIAISRYL